MITWTELINRKIISKAHANKITDSAIIADLIKKHDISAMAEGVRYYENEADILDRKRYYYKDGVKTLDPTKANHRLPHNWQKLLVDQKTAYLVGKPIVFKAEEGQEKYEELLNLILGEEWDDTLSELVKNSSNKGTEWLHLYINSEGLFKFVIIPAEEIIPIYDTSLQENLEAVLRYYPIEVDGGKEGKKERYRVEWWTRDAVTFYIEGENGVFVLDDTEPVNPAPHYYLHESGYGWGKVPFSEFPNNAERHSDLKFYKELVDEYDLTVSGLANDLAEIQEVITILKGYQGEDLGEYMENLRYYKAVSVSADQGSGVDKLEVTIPIEAKKEMLDRLEENIFLFGQGVNMKTDRFGNSPSGVALKFLYSLLDLKASTTERKIRRSIKRVLWFVTEYLRISPDHKAKYDSTTEQVTFRKTMITNESENVKMARESVGIISDETIISNHPWVEDAQDELDRLEEQERKQRERDAEFLDDYGFSEGRSKSQDNKGQNPQNKGVGGKGSGSGKGSGGGK